MIRALPELPPAEVLSTRLDSAGIGSQPDREKIIGYVEALRPRLQCFVDATMKAVPLSASSGAAMHVLESRMAAAKTQLEAFERDAKDTDFGELGRERAELASRQWLSQQEPAIREEVERLEAIADLDDAKRLTRTGRLSRLATTLSEEHVTQAFRDRFRSELMRFGADYLRVELTKSRTTKGRVLHRLVLKTDSSHRSASILSDGEKRIVSLAACFADFLAEDQNVPFVFDDPMSSLDQEHEERVADRLVELADSRQVIVFTHRLPFMVALTQSAAAKGLSPKVSSLERTSWGAGVPGGAPLRAQAPKRALNQLANERVSALRKAERARRLSDVRALTAELCRDVRITLENIVEKELLGDVVSRFRRDINTKGKLSKVAAVHEDDCGLMETMMTK